MYLCGNFRSCQSIVNVACTLQNIGQCIIGHAQDLCCSNAAVYYEYENEAAAVEFFIEFLRRYDISLQNAIALTRNTSLKEKLKIGTSLDYEHHAIINAVQLWKIDSPESKKQAMLENIGLIPSDRNTA